MMSANERYSNDPQFRALVDNLHNHIREAKFTPTEIREAAILAQIHYESYTFRPVFVDPDNPTRLV